MIFIILSVLLIVVSIVERYLSLKKKETWERFKIHLGVTIVFIFFLISYFTTDTFIGLLYVFALSLLLSIINLAKYFENKERYTMIGYGIGIPMLTILMLKSIGNILTDFRVIFLLVLIINTILSYPNKEKATKKETICLAMGGIISLAIIFVINKNPNPNHLLLSRHEIVAEEYLEKNFGESDSYIFVTRSNINLRGKDIEIMAIGLNNPSLKLLYNNGEIKSYLPIN